MNDAAPRVLIVEDDLDIGTQLIRGLRAHGFAPALHTCAEDAVERMLGEGHDALVLDLMLPDGSGLEVLERLRSRSRAPVIVLTAGIDLDTRVEAFRLGAADFVPKPFFLEELVARLRARLGGIGQARRVVAWADVQIDLDGRRVLRAGEDVGLTTFEFNVLAALVERPGRALTRQTLCELALSADESTTERTVDSHVMRLRRKLGDAGDAVRTVWRVGYRFDAASDA